MTMITSSRKRNLPRRSPQHLHLLIFLTLAALSPARAQNCSHDGGLWGAVKHSVVEPIVTPAREALGPRYRGLSDKGRFLAGACAGFGASRLAVRGTVKTVKIVGAAYIAFEALEYAGLLKEARKSELAERNQQALAQSRDYFLRTVDGIRHDVRTHLNPKRISRRVNRNMEKDKPGTVGFGTGAFLGFLL